MKFHRIYSVPLNLGRHINKIEALWSENSRGLLVRVERFERSAPWTQITCATNCATPGYSFFCHYTTARGKNKDFSVCGHSCGQSRFCAVFCNRGKSRKRRCRKALRRFALPCPGYRHGTPKAGAVPTPLYPDIFHTVRPNCGQAIWAFLV